MFFEKYTKIALKILSQDLKRKYINVIFLNLLNVFLDILSLIAIYPLATSLVGQSNTSLDIMIDDFFFKFNLDLANKSLYALYFFITTIILKNILLVYIKYKTASTIERIFKEISFMINKKILSKNFSYFANNHQPVLLKNLREIPIEFKNYLDVYLNYYVSILNLTIITLTLIFFNFKVTFLILVYIFLTTIFYKVTLAEKARIWGRKGNIWAGKIYTHIADTINLIHEIKLKNKLNFFLNKHSSLIKEWSNLIFRGKFLSSITRPIFEIFLIIPILILLIIFNASIIDTSYFPILAVYLYAAFRTLPALVNLNISELRKKNYFFAIEYLKELFEDEKRIAKEEQNLSQNKNQFKFKKKIELKNIKFKFPSSNDNLLDDLNFEINKFDFIGIKGKSGAGKSTLIKIILGLLEPTSGKIIIDDHLDFKKVETSYKDIMSYVPQNLFLLNDTILNNIAFGLEDEIINEKKVWDSLTLASAKDFVNKLDNKLKFEIKNNGQNLSGGQAQRIAIARALYHNPEIIILDEATNSLDNLTEKKFIHDLLKLKGKITIVFISHKLSSLEFCDKIFELDKKDLKKVYNNE